MKNFTKLFLITILLASHLLGFAVEARSNAASGVALAYKGGTKLWKLMPERRQQLNVSAQNARPAFVAKDNAHTCSKMYALAVSNPSFHTAEAKAAPKSMFASVTLAALAPGRDLKPLPSINAYPNPSRGITRLSLSLPGNDNYKIRVSNTIGRVVATQELNHADAPAAIVELDMRSLPSGIYFYSLLVNDKTVETKRLVLQK